MCRAKSSTSFFRMAEIIRYFPVYETSIQEPEASSGDAHRVRQGWDAHGDAGVLALSLRPTLQTESCANRFFMGESFRRQWVVLHGVRAPDRSHPRRTAVETWPRSPQ